MHSRDWTPERHSACSSNCTDCRQPGKTATSEMASKPLNVQSMLSAAFLKAELEFLHGHENFREALKLVNTASEFEQLCDLGEELLGAHGRANKSAQQFRSHNNRRSSPE